MPKIIINEIDNTTPVMSAEGVYTVFIPGNAEEYTDDNKHLFGNYTLFTKLSDFVELVGNPYYTVSNPYKILDETDKYADPGHRIASICLAHNLPVLYYIPEAVATYKYQVIPKPVIGVTAYVDQSGSKVQVSLTVTPVAEHTYCTYDGSVYAVADVTGGFSDDTDYYDRTGEEGSYEYTRVYTGKDTATYYEYVFDGYRVPTYNEIYSLVNSDSTNIFEPLTDKSLYDIRYVCNGGYGVVTYDTTGEKIVLPKSVDYVKAVAETRQDCITLVDFDSSLKYTNLANLITTDKLDGISSTYIQLATPWCVYDNVALPANTAILEAFGNQVNTAPNWFATAGYTRGKITGEPIEVIGENGANTLIHSDNVSINPITKVSTSATNYDILIWGNRTSFYDNSGLKASAFLNIRQLCCDLKKRLYRSAKQYVFEQNTDRLWFNFKASIEEFLNNALTNEGISGYKIYKLPTSERAKIKALVKIVPIEAVEDFDLTIELADTVEVTES